MNLIEHQEFLRNEIVPIMKDVIVEYLEVERPDEWFEEETDMDEFANEELNLELIRSMKQQILADFQQCLTEYDFSQIDSIELNDVILFDLANELWEQLKEDKLEHIRELFDMQDYENEYRSYEDTEY